MCFDHINPLVRINRHCSYGLIGYCRPFQPVLVPGSDECSIPKQGRRPFSWKLDSRKQNPMNWFEIAIVTLRYSSFLAALSLLSAGGAIQVRQSAEFGATFASSRFLSQVLGGSQFAEPFSPRLMVQREHSGGMWCLAISHNKTWIATGGGEGRVILWRISTGKAILCLDGHSGGVTSVAFSPDGKWLFTAGDDKTARLWEIASGKQVRRFVGHSSGLTSVAVTSDGKVLISGSYDGTARSWDIGTGTQMKSFIGHRDSVLSLALSRDGKRFVTGGGDCTARMWDVESGKPLWIADGHLRSVGADAFSKWPIRGNWESRWNCSGLGCIDRQATRLLWSAVPPSLFPF